MRGLVFVVSVGVLVAFAGVAAGHDFINDNAAAGGGNHRCTGRPTWTGTAGVISQGISLPDPQDPEGDGMIELRVYVHVPPHGAPPYQDPVIEGTEVRMPGILWLESNGLAGFQKNDFVCIATDGGHADPQVHGDDVIL